MTKKRKLLKELEELGFKQTFIKWMAKRYTAKEIHTFIKNHKMHDTIWDMVRKQNTLP